MRTARTLSQQQPQRAAQHIVCKDAATRSGNRGRSSWTRLCRMSRIQGCRACEEQSLQYDPAQLLIRKVKHSKSTAHRADSSPGLLQSLFQVEAAQPH